MKHHLFAVATAAIAVSAFIACDRGSKEIRIGGVSPVTGEAATFGVSTKNGYDMAVAEWNAKGGVLGKPVKMAFGDDKGDPAEAATVWAKLIEQDKVCAIVGTTMSKCSLAGAPISQASKIPMISPGSTNPKVTLVGNYIFRVSYTDPFQGTVGAKFASETLKAKKAACLFDVGNDYAKGLAEFFKEKFTAMGGEMAGFEGHATGTTDFKAQLTKILPLKPDVIYVSDYYNDVALIAKQARELGYKGPMLGGDGWASPKVMELGGPAVDGCFFTNHYSSEDTAPAVQNFVKNYQVRYNAVPDALAALGYDSAYLLLDAINRAGSTDGDTIRQAMVNADFKGVLGECRFDANRNPVKSVVIIQIKDGKQHYFCTVNP